MKQIHYAAFLEQFLKGHSVKAYVFRFLSSKFKFEHMCVMQFSVKNLAFLQGYPNADKSFFVSSMKSQKPAWCNFS